MLVLNAAGLVTFKGEEMALGHMLLTVVTDNTGAENLEKAGWRKPGDFIQVDINETLLSTNVSYGTCEGYRSH